MKDTIGIGSPHTSFMIQVPTGVYVTNIRSSSFPVFVTVQYLVQFQRNLRHHNRFRLSTITLRTARDGEARWKGPN